MEYCDVAIVGGGPAGSTCASQLRAGGMDVVVLDKQRFPRDKVCAGWITPEVLALLALDWEDYRQHYVLQSINSFRTGLIDGPEVFTQYDHTVSYGIRRCEFDHYLLQRSQARLALGEPLKHLERDGDTWLINNRLRTPLIIGAGGHFCPVARHLGANPGSSEQVVAAQEVEFKLSAEQQRHCRIEPDTPELYFCRDLRGYGWCFRKGDYLNIGLGREDSHKLSSHVTKFLELLIEKNKLPNDVPTRFKGHAYLLYTQRQPRKLIDDGVLLIGDAAGLAYPQSGEGIRPAVESGLIAADVVLALAGNYSGDHLARYETQLITRFGERRRRTGLIDCLPLPLTHYLAKKLMASVRFSRHTVLDRWFLHRDGVAPAKV